MSDMDKYINNLVCEFKRSSYEDVEDCSDTEKLLYLYAYYHFVLHKNKNPTFAKNWVPLLERTSTEYRLSGRSRYA